jgi:L,D-transpeptidase catalytic domain
VVHDDADKPDSRDQQRPVDSAPAAVSAAEAKTRYVSPPPTRRSRLSLALAGGVVAVVAAALGVVAVVTTPATTQSAPRHLSVGAAGDPLGALQNRVQPVVSPVPVSDAILATLPQATTFGTVPDAPTDPAPQAVPSGRVVHPTVTVPAFASPGGAPIAAVPAQQSFGVPPKPATDTWLPVIAEQPGWAQVLLPVRPNHATGWIYMQDPRITTAHTEFRIEVDRKAFSLKLFKDGTQVGRWTVGVGKLGTQGDGAESITPSGRTFLLGDVREEHPTYSPVIMPLGLHSNTFSTYGGGPGTIGVHTWLYSNDVYGQNSSDGCVRVPMDALQFLSSEVPLGTAVLIK